MGRKSDADGENWEDAYVCALGAVICVDAGVDIKFEEGLH